VVCTLDEKWIIRWEIDTIAALHTYRKDPLSSKLACNESAGGEGRSRMTFETPTTSGFAAVDFSDLIENL
jgi:hypothetical protein